MTMTEPVQWRARMIGGPDAAVAVDPVVSGGDLRRPPVIRCDFTLPGPADWPGRAPVSAKLHVTAWGLFEAWVNGERAGDDVLAPGWTVYDRRLPYWTYDVTGLVRPGANAMEFWLADGWYRGRIGFGGGRRDCYGSRLGLCAQLEVAYADGTTTIVASNAHDGLWKTGCGPILASGLYEGEAFDARESAPGPDGWQPVDQLDFDPSVLYPADGSTAVRRIGEHRVTAISRLPDGRWLVDFGQNCTQRVALAVPRLEPGHVIDVRHVEVLNPDGTPATRPLRRAIQHDRYISDGTPAVWEPHFTMHGFRYAVIGGWPEDRPLTAGDIHTRVYSSARERTGWFSCSDARVNRLAENARWSMLSNFVSIPTDCPQRDERFGWTGDIAVFAPTAMWLYDVAGFLDGWLEDMAIETDRWGTVPYYVPYPYPGWGKPDAVALWGDAAVMVPWALYMATGDRAILARHWALARRWVDQVAGLLAPDGVWDRKPDVWCGQLGDWLDPTAPPDDAARAMTAKPLVATAFAAHSAALAARMAGVLGDAAARTRYGTLAAHIRAGFRARFVRDDGTMASDTQCSYALLIAFGLLDGSPDHDRLLTAAGDRLAALVRERGYVIGTGFAGTPYVLPALVATGHADEAFGLFLSDRCPSWLYQVRMGATTTWERWDSMLPDGEVNPGDMTSFNHYAFGSVLDWMRAAIGGLELIAPGWSRVRVAPCLASAVAHGIRSASAAHATPHGRISVSWHVQDDGEVLLDVEVPDGVVAELGPGRTFVPGMHRFSARLHAPAGLGVGNCEVLQWTERVWLPWSR